MNLFRRSQRTLPRAMIRRAIRATCGAAICAMVCVALAAPLAPALAQGGSDPQWDAEPPPAARLTGLRHEFQTWCNCGPVNLMMALSYYGWPHNQTVTAAWLKPRIEDKNVSPDEMVAFVAVQDDLPDLRAVMRVGGDVNTLRRLIAAGFPVIVESGFQIDEHEWLGHYLTAIAYEDASQTIFVYDSYYGYGADGLGLRSNYADFEGWWSHFNYTFVVIYPARREAEMLAALGPLADETRAAAIALDRAHAALAADPLNSWAAFNVGTSALALGRYHEAARHFDRAGELGLPFRMLWYQFGPYAAYFYTGRYYDVLALARATEAITDEIEETSIWRGLALAALDDRNGALQQLERALALNPNSQAARAALDSVRHGTFTAPAPLTIHIPPLP